MTRTAFHQQLLDIEAAIFQLGALVEQALARAMQAHQQRDTLLVISATRDTTTQELRRSIRNRCIDLMACQAPVARDLRELLTIQLVVSELEHISDHVVGIVSQTIQLRGVPERSASAATTELSAITQTLCTLVCESLKALVMMDAQQAQDVYGRTAALERQLQGFAMQAHIAPVNGQLALNDVLHEYTRIALVAADLERIGQCVRHICSNAFYLATGELFDSTDTSDEREGSDEGRAALSPASLWSERAH